VDKNKKGTRHFVNDCLMTVSGLLLLRLLFVLRRLIFVYSGGHLAAAATGLSAVSAAL
jgi:hypothetical protein